MAVATTTATNVNTSRRSTLKGGFLAPTGSNAPAISTGTAATTNAPAISNGSGGGGGGGVGGGVGGSNNRITLQTSKTILKSVTVFLASGKRNTNNQSKLSEAEVQAKRRLRQRRMDELSGKINPKLLENLRKKTRFTNASGDGGSGGKCLSSGRDMCGILMVILDLIVLSAKMLYAILEALVLTVMGREEQNVRGTTVLITGTGHGIGKETALQYSALGAKLICWDINEKNNQQTVKEIQAAGGTAVAYTCNVTNRSEINELAERVKQEHGFVGIVVNNAGIMPCHPISQHTETEIRNMYEINVLAHFWIIQAFLPEMIERNEGHIVALSSCAGLFGIPNLVPYCGTKFAVRGIMESLAAELHRYHPHNKIKLTTIYPYMVDTGLCKRPRYRFPNLMKLVTPKEAAASIIKAQRTHTEHASIPRHFLFMDRAHRLLPKKCMRLLNDFLDAGVDSDL